MYGKWGCKKLLMRFTGRGAPTYSYLARQQQAGWIDNRLHKHVCNQTVVTGSAYFFSTADNVMHVLNLL